MRRLICALCLFVSFRAFAAMDGAIQKRLPGCKTRAIMERAIELVDQKDYAAGDEIFRRGIESGECRVFVTGESVIVELREIKSGLSKIHLRGNPEAYWVINPTVDPRN
jgi:hypothetical protein